MNNCPKCNVSINETDTECPACGIFFSKWKEREDNVATGNVSRYHALANATSSEFNWVIFLIVIAVVAAVGYYLFRSSQLTPV